MWAVFATLAAAQIGPAVGEGLSAGRLRLYPSLTIEYDHDDNVFYAPQSGAGEDILASSIRVFKPRLQMDLPFGENRIRWAYSPTYRDYAKVSQSENVSHFVDFDGEFKLGRSVTLGLRDHFVRGTTELREIDPGGETTFGLVPFRLHTPELGVDLALAARHGISLISRYTSTQFDESDSAAFFDSSRKGGEARYNYRLDTLDTLYGYYALDLTDEHRPALDTVQTARTVGLGFRRVINLAVTSQVSAGYRTLRFEQNDIANYSGLVLDAAAVWQPRDTTRINFTLRRSPYPSFFENNSFYLVDEAEVRILEQIGQSLYWSAAVAAQANRYPLVSPTYDVRRRDRVLNLEVGLGRQFLRSLRAFVGYNRDHRESNVEPVTYNVDRIIFRLEMGWL